jgi:hypothetical protein
MNRIETSGIQNSGPAKAAENKMGVPWTRSRETERR